MVHDQGTPEEGEQGSWQAKALQIKAGTGYSPAATERLWDTKSLKGGQGSESSTRPPGAQNESTPRDDTFVIGQSVHVVVPGFRTGKSRPSHQSTKYLKTGTKTRHPTGLAAGAARPEWLRGLERYFRRGPGGAFPDQNRAWIARERDRNVRQKLAEGGSNGQDTPKTKNENPDGHLRGGHERGQGPDRSGNAMWK